MSNKTELQANNVDLATILSTVQSLPVYEPPEGLYVWKKYEILPLITFTISGIECNAEEGMTWAEWVASSYNTIDAGITDVWVHSVSQLVFTYNNTPVSTTDLIINNAVYASVNYCCFVEGTKITMHDNSLKNIEEVVSGDKVLSYNTLTNEIVVTDIKKLIINENNTEYANLMFDDGSHLEMASYHPLYTSNGWRSLTNYNNYETLIVGDMLKTIDGYKELIDINVYEQEPIITYTLDVYQDGYDSEEFSNFFANNTLSHNASCL